MSAVWHYGSAGRSACGLECVSTTSNTQDVGCWRCAEWLRGVKR